MSTIQERRDALRRTPSDGPSDESGSGRTLRLTLLAIIAVMVLAIAAAAGFLLRGDGSDGAAMPGDASADAGFARDMITHHEQAVQMAAIVEYSTADPQVRTLAYDIESSQTFQQGQMNGWLDSWGLSRQTSQPLMGWMSDDGMHHDHGASAAASESADPTGENVALMPGMATPAQIEELTNATGTAQDILFLQLMLRHHQSGIEMAQQGADRASEPYVQALARNMATIQAREVVLMEQMLRERGAQPLPS